MPKFNEWNPSHEGKLCVISIRIKLKGEVGMAGQKVCIQAYKGSMDNKVHI